MYVHPINHPVGFGHMADVQSTSRFGGMARVEEDPLTPVWRSACLANGGESPESKLLWQTTNGLLEAARAAGNITAAQEATLDAQIWESETGGSLDFTITKTGAACVFAADEGTVAVDNAFAMATSKNMVFTLISIDGFSAVGYITAGSSSLTGSVPDVTAFTGMTRWFLYGNNCSGDLPDFSQCTSLVYAYGYGSAWTGPPDFDGCDILDARFNDCGFSGEFPDVSNWRASGASYHLRFEDNSFSSVADGSLSDLPSISTLYLQANSMAEAAVDGVLAQCLVNETATPTLAAALNLSGTGMSAPGAQGDTDRLALVAAGWTVTAN